jgi:hypothetical protein
MQIADILEDQPQSSRKEDALDIAGEDGKRINRALPVGKR